MPNLVDLMTPRWLLPTGLLLVAAAVAGSATATYVAVGGSGFSSVLTVSQDGIEWSDTHGLNGVAWANGLWVAVGDEGVIKTSFDTVTWTQQASGTAQALYDVTFASGMWMAVGEGGTILFSGDGILWDVQCPLSPGCLPGSYESVAYDGNQWILVRGVSVGANANILTSPGAPWTWTEQNSGSTGYPLHAVAANGPELVAVGHLGAIRGSPNGVAWAPEASPSGSEILEDVATDGTQFVIVANGGMILSRPVGTVAWNDQSNGNTLGLIGIAGDGNTWVAVGWPGVILTSITGTSWTQQTSGTSLGLNAVAFDDEGQWVAVGVGGIILSSPDGYTWAQRAGSPTNAQLNDVAYGNGLWVTVGHAGTILSSTDTVQWTKRTSGTTAVLEAVAFDGSSWIAVGWSGTVLTSPDGITWSVQSLGATTTLRDVAGDGTLWVAVGNSGKLYTSPTGVAWTLRPTGVTYTLHGLHHAGTRWVVAMAPGVLHSTDGLSWTSIVMSGSTLYGVTNTGPQWVAAGLSGALRTSPDGLAWAASASTGANFHDITTDGTLRVMVGSGGRIYTSTDTLAWAPRDSGTTAELYGVASSVKAPDPPLPPAPGALVASLTPGAANGYSTTTFLLAPSVSGGQPPYSCAWSVAPATATLTPPASPCTGSATLTNGVPGTTYTVTLAVTDSQTTPVSASATSQLSIYGALKVDVSPASAWGTHGSTFTFTPSVSGGVPTVSCAWSITPPGGTFTAPAPGPGACSGPASFTGGDYATTYTVRLDGTSGSPVVIESAFATIVVSPNSPPQADFTGPSDTSAGQGVVFTDASSDPDGTIVAWLWEFSDGGSSSQSSASHVFARAGRYWVRLTVMDDSGAIGSKTREWVVAARGSVPTAEEQDAGAAAGYGQGGGMTPVADAGADRIAPEGSRVDLQAIGARGMHTTWRQTAGPSVVLVDAATQTPHFTAPGLASEAPVVLRFTLQVSDGGAASAFDHVDITVVSANHAPLIAIGIPQGIAAGAEVTLDATDSTDPDGDTLSYRWTQIGGPAVHLDAADTATPTFIAPGPDAGRLLKFRFELSDGRRTTADVAAVWIEVAPAAAPAEKASAPPQLVSGNAAAAGPAWLPVALAAAVMLAAAVACAAFVVARSKRHNP